MKRTYTLCGLECAHCANKMETAIKKINGVKEATVVFMTQKLSIEADEAEFPRIMEEASKAVKKYERHVVIK